jgi:hypothetical protein
MMHVFAGPAEEFPRAQRKQRPAPSLSLRCRTREMQSQDGAGQIVLYAGLRPFKKGRGSPPRGSPACTRTFSKLYRQVASRSLEHSAKTTHFIACGSLFGACRKRQ